MASRKIFSLFGAIAIEGMANTKKELSAFDKEVRATTRTLTKMSREALKTGKNLTAGFTAPVIGLTSAMALLGAETGKYADKLLDLEQITGLSTDNLQGMESIAIEAGVSFEGLTNTISKFTGRLPEIIKGTGASSDAMKALGIDILDSEGNLKDMNDLFPEMVNRLQGIENITDRNAIAQQVFGKSMGDLAPVLSLSSERFNELYGGANQLSNFMSKDAINSANEYRIIVENLKRTFVGFWRTLAVDLIPILQNTLVPIITGFVFPAFQGLIKVISGVANWFNNLNPILKDGIVIFTGIMAAVGPLLIMYGKFLPLLIKLVPLYKALTTGQLALNFAMTKNPIGLIVTGIAALITAGVLLWKNWDTVKTVFIGVWDYIQYHFANVSDTIAIAYGSMILGILEGINKVGKFIPGLNKGLQSLINTTSKSIDVLNAEKMARKAVRQEQAAQKKLTEQEVAVIEEAKAVSSEYNMSLLQSVEAKKKDAKATDEQIKKEQKLNAEKQKFQDEWENKLFESTATRLQILDREKSEALNIAKELGAETANIEKYYAAQRVKITADATKAQAEQEKKLADERKQKISSYRDQTLGIIGQINDVWAASIDLRLNNIDAESEREKAAIENSLMSNEEKAIAIETIDKESDAKKLELQKENAAREKAFAIFSIILNTAMAITKALSLGMPAGLIFAVLVGALGVAQIAIAAAQPMPFAEGGLVKSSPGQGIVAQIGEGNQDELVLPMKTGAAQLAGSIMDRIGGVGSTAMGMAGKAGNGARAIHLHIGTLIADEYGVKTFAKKVNKYIVADNQRTGVTA